MTRPEETPETKPKVAAKSNIVVVPRRRNAAQSQKLELNDVVDTKRLADQVLHYLNERTDQSAYLWGLRIRSTPMHFYSHLTPTSGARKTTEGYKSRFFRHPKNPFYHRGGGGFFRSGIPESACIQCILLGSECTPIAFGMSCSQCQQRETRGCEHSRTMEELIQFYCEISEKYAKTSDVTEMLLKNLQDAHHRTAGLAKLYAESSEELIDVFKHVSSHIEQVIDYVGAEKFFSRFTDDSTSESLRGHLEELRLNYNRRVSDDAEERRLDTIPAEKIPEDSRLITTDFAALGVAFTNEGPSTPSPKATRSILAKSTLPKEGDSAAGPRSLTDIHHSPVDQEDVDMLQDEVAGTSQPA
ncbi:hypothetical protein B0H14DRAFT_2641467 [Mycena olivaceomarginata]|nr:hypothetical protein B0H14DRAFT_2641467 [Mycena olivaceomarginata]